MAWPPDFIKRDFHKFVRKHTIYNAMLFIKDIYKLKRYDGLYFHKNMPMFGFHIFGIVIEAHKREKVYYIKVNDGTATIKCVLFLGNAKEIDDSLASRKWSRTFAESKSLVKKLCRVKDLLLTNRDIELGALVSVRGNLKLSRGQQELICRHISELKDPDQETFYNLRRLELYERFYNMKYDWPKGYMDHLMQNPTPTLIKELRSRGILSFTRDEIISMGWPILEGPNLERVLSNMENSGFTFRKENHVNMFLIVEHDEEMQEVCEEFVRGQVKKTEEDVTSWMTFRYMKSQKPYSRMTWDAVKHCLRNLESRSVIYSTIDNDHFNIVS